MMQQVMTHVMNMQTGQMHPQQYYMDSTAVTIPDEEMPTLGEQFTEEERLQMNSDYYQMRREEFLEAQHGDELAALRSMVDFANNQSGQ